eukprot:scaffold14821_cov37-Attheya_sp.AAC.1
MNQPPPMRRPPFHHNHGHAKTASIIIQHSNKPHGNHALKNISGRDGTSSSVEGQYQGTSHATTFSALSNQPPSRVQGLRTQRRWRKEEASGGVRERSTTSLEGVEQGVSHAITSPFSSHSNQPIGHNPIPIPITSTITNLAIPLTL